MKLAVDKVWLTVLGLIACTILCIPGTVRAAVTEDSKGSTGLESLYTNIEDTDYDQLDMDIPLPGFDQQLINIESDEEDLPLATSSLMDESNCLHCPSTASRIPEPSTTLCMALFMVGLIAAHWLRRRSKTRSAVNAA